MPNQSNPSIWIIQVNGPKRGEKPSAIIRSNLWRGETDGNLQTRIMVDV